MPNEQKTQQSPGFGRNRAWHFSHSWKKMQASVGMPCTDWKPQNGHVRTDSRIGDVVTVGRPTIKGTGVCGARRSYSVDLPRPITAGMRANSTNIARYTLPETGSRLAT